ncbi:coiled-coil domain-containing protein 102A-like isoform X1 [Agrilus planipennis]|uniref:Coiled-coil domain-containing protein 102A-like isoform X1 n=1 Tax=Agrilus planipennis TaxID=224129 RepID=A0A7F5R1T5_AGRPL|nr:coiled-coil domain-containing protein 102A-like isoform X1 [Agrilus planipennis]XP_025829142.1 coiled-coil domain-containing protein 102A-like isoform X1 [Agrilus planipennis]
MAQSTGGTSSRRIIRDHETSSISSRYADTEWEAKEALRQRELEEARARAAQMEKTMRWWSDCTANWREKWSKVRNERNKAREEAKLLRTKLEAALKDGNCYIREKQEMEFQNEQLKKEIEKIHLLLLKHAGQFESQILEALGDDPLKDFNFSINHEQTTVKEKEIQDSSNITTQQECDSTATSLLCIEKDSCIEEYILQGAVPKYISEPKEDEVTDFDNLPNKACDEKDDNEEDCWSQKVSMLQLKLEETTKTLQVEREEKSQLLRNVEKLSNELQEMKEKCEELRQSRQDAVRELLSLQDQHQEEIILIKADLQEEAASRGGMDRRINDLRSELERLQAENASEWGKRERLETDKLSLERENKKLRAELREIQERLEKKERPLSNSDAEFRQIQQELSDKNKVSSMQ